MIFLTKAKENDFRISSRHVLNYFTLSEQARWEGLSKSLEITGTLRASLKWLLEWGCMANEGLSSIDPLRWRPKLQLQAGLFKSDLGMRGSPTQSRRRNHAVGSYREHINLLPGEDNSH